VVDIPVDIRKRLTFKFVNTMDEVIAEALLPKSEAAVSAELTEPSAIQEPAAADGN